MRFLAVDFGTRRIGLAVCTPDERLVVGAGVLERRRGDDPIPAVAAAAREREVEAVVVGFPLNMDGTIGPKAAEARAFADRLREALKIPVHLHDERLSSAAAEEALRGVPLGRARKRAQVNQVAAQGILESYLDARRTKT
jgi:putative Holliday junction resolvase